MSIGSESGPFIHGDRHRSAARTLGAGVKRTLPPAISILDEAGLLSAVGRQPYQQGNRGRDTPSPPI